MLPTDSARNAQAATKIIGGFFLVDMFFDVGTQYLTTWPLNVSYNGNTYLALGDLASVGTLAETESGAQGTISLALSPVNIDVLALAMGNVEGYRGRPVNVYFWAVDQNYQTVGVPRLRFVGTMDQVSIARSDGGGTGAGTGSITMTCFPAGVDSARKETTLRMNNAQQQDIYPGDRGFEYVPSLIKNPQLWLSRAFQMI